MAGWTTLKTWVPGMLPSADLNTYLRDNVNFLFGTGTGTASRPHLIARQTVAQSLANVTWVNLLFDTNDVDTASGHSTSTSTDRYVCQYPGYYWVIGRAAFANNATGARYVDLAVNGTAVNASRMSCPAGDTVLVTVKKTYLNAGDYLVARVYQSSGAALNTTASTPSDQASSLEVEWTHA